MSACDTIIFLDYSEKECMTGIMARLGKTRPDMPWVTDELDPKLVEEVQRYRTENRPVVLKLLDQYAEKERYIFYSREEAEKWIQNLMNSSSSR